MATPQTFRVGLLVGVVGGGLGGWLGGRMADALFGSPQARENRSGGLRPVSVTGGTVDPRRAAEEFREESGRALQSLQGAQDERLLAGPRGLVALARFYALTGDEGEFLRLAEGALARGATLDEVLAALNEFPTGVQGKVLGLLLDRHPGVPFEPVAVARILADAGDVKRALGVVRQALPQQGDFHPGLSRLLMRLDPDAGPDVLFGLPGADKWDEEALGVLRAVLIEADREDRMLPFLARALDDRPGDHGALRALRRLDPDAASERVQALLRSDPHDPWAWSFLGSLRKDAGDPAGAFEAYKNAAAREPSRDTFIDLVEMDAARGVELVAELTKGTKDDELLGAAALAYARAGRTDDARRTLLEAIARDPNDSEWTDRLIHVDPAAAVASIEGQLAAAGGVGGDELLGRYGRALAAAGRKEDAFRQFLAAYRKDPRDTEWKEAMVDLDVASAGPVLEAHVRDHPADAAGRGAYGRALASLGRRDAAAREFERAMELGDPGRWYQALRSIDAERALAALRRRAQANARDGDVWGLLGEELANQDRGREAREAFERALEADPANRDWARALRVLAATGR
jgi:tetratricopeptide (TPR) repeat protein